MLLKITPNEYILRRTLKISFSIETFSKNLSDNTVTQFHKQLTSPQIFAVFLFCKDNSSSSFISPKYLCNAKIFTHNIIFIMGNKRKRRSRRVESQSSDRDENVSEASFTRGNATLVDVSENVNNIFDKNLGSELTEPSQISNEIEIISQRLSE